MSGIRIVLAGGSHSLPGHWPVSRSLAGIPRSRRKHSIVSDKPKRPQVKAVRVAIHAQILKSLLLPQY